MAIEIKQRVRMEQQLVVTPQLQQAIKLLQLSRLELSNLIQTELMENPVLEDIDDQEIEAQEEEDNKSESEKHEDAVQEDRGHDHTSDEIGEKDGELKLPNDFDWGNYIGAYNAPDYDGDHETIEDGQTYENVLTQSETLHDHLLWQLYLTTLSVEEKEIGTEIIGNINDDGYFQSSTEELSQRCNIDIKTVEKVLQKIQDFDPAGIAARDLQECLILQAKQLNKDTDLLTTLIKDHLTDLEYHKYDDIAKKLNLSLEVVQALAKVISCFDPKPGRPYSQETPLYIVPDVYVQKEGDNYEVLLNEDGMPKLRISNFYKRAIMKGSEANEQTKTYVQDRLRAALWLIKSIHQRQRTLYKVAKSIVKYQKGFFDKGISHLKPLVLRDVAEDIGMHESTVSRVTTNKYMHSPRGIFELKFFFNAGIHHLEGGGIASEAVKDKIQKMIENENTKSPLSDQKIAEILKQHNIDIARRTVAKYREMLKIPSSSRRKKR
ncbi:MAG: RNA polymerase sigma-54 factor [Deltaproteobacteria bacterium CG07_land_8_20_14_0_80_38_7]|nr:MAG: RNA polymerase sigma-54 factor [Deltaproteobacteria bacterium CG07_land_8_20_14_0_80_38_7]